MTGQLAERMTGQLAERMTERLTGRLTGRLGAGLLGAGLVLIATLGACRQQPAASPPGDTADPPRTEGDARCDGPALADVPWQAAPAGMSTQELVAALRDRPADTPVRLDVTGQGRGDAFVIELAGSGALGGVRELRLAGNALGPAAMRALDSAPGLDCLQRLDVSKNPVTDEGFALLCTAGTTRHLRALVLDGSGLTGASLALLPGCVWSASLEELSLVENDFSELPRDAAAAQTRAAPEAWSRLVALDLGRTRCRVPCLTYLRDAGLFTALQRLALEGLFGPAEARVLAAGAFDRLTTLRLFGMADLSEADSDMLGDAGLEILVEAPMFARVEELVLPLHGIGDPGVTRLAGARHGTRLRRLDLRANGIGDDGARALMNGAYTRDLAHLDLADTLISDEMANTLRAHYGARVQVGQ